MNTKGKLMISCKDSTFLSSKKQLAPLTLGEKMQQLLHLMVCKYCRRFAKQIKLIDRALYKMHQYTEEGASDVCLSDAQKERMQEVLKNAK